MNLRFTILAGDEAEGYEYTTDNNSLYRSLEPVSLFDVPDTLNLILGNTVEIPVGISNTRVTEEPSVTVREVSGADGKEEKYLGSLFYNADTKKLTITPEKTGTGIIRIADLKTGSFTDMAFAVKPCTNVGTEEKNYVLGSEDALGTFYSHPVYQYADYTQWNTTTSDYIQFDLTLKSNVKGKYTWDDKGLPVYLNDLKIVQSGDKTDITDAVRVHFSAKSSEDNSVVNTLVSKNGGDTLTTGKLDLNGDGKDDTPKENMISMENRLL